MSRARSRSPDRTKSNSSKSKSASAAASAAQQAALEKKQKLQHDFFFDSDQPKQLRQELRRIDAEMTNEYQLLNNYQQEKNKFDQFLKEEKNKREEIKLILRNKLREKQDLEEKQSYELKIYKQKVKHLLSEQAISLTDLKYKSETKLDSEFQEQRKSEHFSNVENRELGVRHKNQEVENDSLVKSMKFDQEKEIYELRLEYSRKQEECKHSYEKQMKTIRDTYDEIRKEEVNKIENIKNLHIQDLISKHKRKFDKIKKYYSDITHANLELIKNLKEEVGDMKKKEAAVIKEVNEINRINKKLSAPLMKNRKLVVELRKELEKYKEDKIKLTKIKKNLVNLEEEIKNKEWEKEVLEQKLDMLTEEVDDINKIQVDTILNTKQKNGFKNLLLNKKLSLMEVDLEKTKAALTEVLASTNLHPDVISDLSTLSSGGGDGGGGGGDGTIENLNATLNRQLNLEDILLNKNKQIQQLADELSDLDRKYKAVRSMAEKKLAHYSIPVEELAFEVMQKL